MILFTFILVVAVYVYVTRGGSGSARVDATPAPTAPATSEVASEPEATAPPWPAKFAEYFCTAVGENAIFVEDLRATQASLVAGDLKKAGQHALSAETDALVIQTALEAAPAWEPAADAVKSWRAAVVKVQAALKHIRQAANRADAKLMKQAGREITAGGKLINKATLKVESFVAATGFSC
jgi:hypothetical protein